MAKPKPPSPRERLLAETDPRFFIQQYTTYLVCYQGGCERIDNKMDRILIAIQASEHPDKGGDGDISAMAGKMRTAIGRAA